MRNVLADLALESEAATALAMRLARAFDAQEDEAPSLLRRLLTPAAKFWICKRGPAVAAEAMEVLGGNGYVEEGPLARIYRQMPLNSIWEGSGNVMCLDVLRALARDAALPRGARRRACAGALRQRTSRSRTPRGCSGSARNPAARGPGARADAADRACRAGRAAGALRAGGRRRTRSVRRASPPGTSPAVRSATCRAARTTRRSSGVPGHREGLPAARRAGDTRLRYGIAGRGAG